MTLTNLTAVQLAFRARVLSLPTLPTLRAWENVQFVPVTGQSYVAEQFVPGPASLISAISGGTVETRGLYVIMWYAPANTGLGTLTAGADALLALFPPGSTFASTTGDVVRIRGDTAPYRGQMRLSDSAAGWSMLPVTIPWRVYSSLS